MLSRPAPRRGPLATREVYGAGLLKRKLEGSVPVAGALFGAAINGAAKKPSEPPPLPTVDPDETKQAAKLRKIELLTKALLDEWSTLGKSKKSDASKLFEEGWTFRVPQESSDALSREVLTGMEAAGISADAEEEEEAPEEVSAQATTFAARAAAAAVEPVAAVEPEEGEVAEGEDAEADEEAVDTSMYEDDMAQLLKDAAGKGKDAYAKLWGSREDELAALLALLEAALKRPISDLAPKIVAELAREGTVQVKSVERACKRISAKLEELAVKKEDCWHLLAHMSMLLFPKTESTPWGWDKTDWSWIKWWQMTERILGKADASRAFDVCLMALQLVQDTCEGNSLRKQQVWREKGRAERVRQTLAKWGEMDRACVADVLGSYALEL